MPYKVKGSIVYVKRGSKWVVLKRHESHERAVRHHRALEANVKHK